MRIAAAAGRRTEFRRFVGDGMRAGYAAEDGVGLDFVGEDLHRVVTSRPGRCAYRVVARQDGTVVEEPLPADELGATAPPPELVAVA